MKHAMWVGLILWLVCGDAGSAQTPSSETPYDASDFNEDGRVDFLDLLLFQENWHRIAQPTLTPVPVTPSPTPTSVHSAYTGNGPGASTIGVSGGEDYPSLKAACDAVNAIGSLDGGDWTFFITTDLTETSDVFLGANTNGNTIIFKPQPGVTATISFAGATSGWTTTGGANFAIGLTDPLTFVSGTRVTVDGSNEPGGDTRDLTLIGSTTTTPAAQARRTLGIYRDSDDFTVKNVILANSGTQMRGATGLVPDNILYDNCSITIQVLETRSDLAGSVTYRNCDITNISTAQRLFTLNSMTDITFDGCTIYHTSSNSNQIQALWCGVTSPKVITFKHCTLTNRNAGLGANSGGAFVLSFIADTVNFYNNSITLLGAAAGSRTGSGMAIVEVSDAVSAPAANVNFLHNSVVMRTTADTGEGGLPRFGVIVILDGSSAYTGTTVFRNNVVLNMWHTKNNLIGAGALIRRRNTGTVISDNNLIYADPVVDPNNCYGFDNGIGHVTRAEWTAATGQDANSSDRVNPLVFWTSIDDFHFATEPAQDNTDWAAPRLELIADDLDGHPRGAATTAKGAVESSHFRN